MEIKRANETHIGGLNKLLLQVLTVHHEGRPDIFRSNSTKYTNDELKTMLSDDTRPIFVATDEENNVLGYCFCIIQQVKDSNILTDIKTLYIDDLCVDSFSRGQHVGTGLYDYVRAFAKEIGCYNITLNVWALNEGAIRFYQKLGLLPQKYGMEEILS